MLEAMNSTGRGAHPDTTTICQFLVASIRVEKADPHPTPLPSDGRGRGQVRHHFAEGVRFHLVVLTRRAPGGVTTSKKPGLATRCHRLGLARWMLLVLLLTHLLTVLSSRGGDSQGPMFDVRAFGARGDGKTLDTVAIQKALDSAGHEKGTVHFPPGTYLSKPIYFQGPSYILLDRGAMLKATDDPEDFADPARPDNFVSFVNARGLTNIGISGPGIIDGSGGRWWIPAEAARKKTPGYTLPRPRMVTFTDCKDVLIENVTLQNSPCFHLVPNQCENFLITNVTILSPKGSANTDAIDPSNSRHVMITHCLIDVGDDNVAIKAGHAMPGRAAACDDIAILDCTFLHGHGVSIGSETRGGVSNVRVERCTFQGTENGLRIKSPRGKGGLVENVIYKDITMTDVEGAITITCYYPKIPLNDSAQTISETTPIFKNIRISNLKAISSKSAGIIIGLPESPITGLVLDHVQIDAATTGLIFQNARDVRLNEVSIHPAKGQPIITRDAQVRGKEGHAN
jgi:polygalacturonase